jgi:hypothetical protein
MSKQTIIIVGVIVIVVGACIFNAIGTILRGPQVGDKCRSDGLLCDRPLCGGEFVEVSAEYDCTVIAVDDRFDWVELQCPGGHGWSELCLNP